MRNERGVTLIALIITILVMVILAVVSISAILGDNGVIEKTEYAKEEQRGATVEEQKDLWKSSIKTYETSNKLATAPQELEELLDDLLNKKDITEAEKQQIMDFGFVKIGSRTILFDERTNMNLLGYYADIEGDGIVDGIIYIDNRFFSNGIEDKKNEYKEYYIIQKNYEGPLGTNDVVTTYGGNGKDRFFIMALDNISGEYPYFTKELPGAYSSSHPFYPFLSMDLTVTGKERTLKILNYWNSVDYIEGVSEDVWGKIQQGNYRLVNQGGKWFIPSSNEWLKFGNMINELGQYIEEGWYWSTSMVFLNSDPPNYYRVYNACFHGKTYSKCYYATTEASIRETITSKIRLSAIF